MNPVAGGRTQQQKLHHENKILGFKLKGNKYDFCHKIKSVQHL